MLTYAGVESSLDEFEKMLLEMDDEPLAAAGTRFTFFTLFYEHKHTQVTFLTSPSAHRLRDAGAHFTCFTSTTVQILTPGELIVRAASSDSVGAASAASADVC